MKTKGKEARSAVEDRLLTCAEVARRYGVTVATVWRWIRTGKLQAVRVGNRIYRVEPEALVAFERSR